MPSSTDDNGPGYEGWDDLNDEGDPFDGAECYGTPTRP